MLAEEKTYKLPKEVRRYLSQKKREYLARKKAKIVAEGLSLQDTPSASSTKPKEALRLAR